MANKQAKVCQICFENKPAKTKIYKNTIRATKCHNTHVFCKDCITIHIHYKLQDKIGPVRCPADGCTMTLDPMVYRSLIPQPIFVEWCDLLAESWIARHSRRRSICPSEACSEIIIDECWRSSKAAREECPKCKEAFCFKCGQKWKDHDIDNCSHEDRVFISAARKWRWQRCPNCRFFVELADGCGRIRCRCGTTFCYFCGDKKIFCRCLTHCGCGCILMILFACGIFFYGLLPY